MGLGCSMRGGQDEPIPSERPEDSIKELVIREWGTGAMHLEFFCAKIVLVFKVHANGPLDEVVISLDSPRQIYLW